MTYDFMPKKNIKAPAALSLVLFVLAVGVFAAAGYGLAPVALLQFVGSVFGCAAIFILVKFVVMSYVYRIEEKEDGTADLYVIEASAKRNRKLCLISLESVSELVELPDGKIKNSAAAGAERVYNFCLELSPSRAWALLVEDGDGRYAIKLPHDDEMINLIRKHIAK